jgi:hypothetical protein
MGQSPDGSHSGTALDLQIIELAVRSYYSVEVRPSTHIIMSIAPGFWHRITSAPIASVHSH